MSNQITPSEIPTVENLRFSADLETAHENFTEDPKRFGCDGELRTGKKTTKFKFNGEVVSNGILAKAWVFDGKKGTAYSLGIDVSETDAEGFDALSTIMENYLEENSSLCPDWKVRTVNKGERVILKLAVNDKKFECRINGDRIDAANYHKIGLEDEAQISVRGTIVPKFKFKEKKAEINFVVTHLDFESEVEPTPRKRIHS